MKKIRGLVLLLLVLALPARGFDFPEVRGWTPAGTVVTWGPENLWQEINGAADKFLGYGFQLLYQRRLAAAGVEVTVSVYDMGSRLSAFGVYRTEASARLESLAIGGGAVVAAPYQCLLLKDRFYVKVDVTLGEIDEAAGGALLAALAAALPGADGLPEVFASLPAAGRVAGSEGYENAGFLGLEELGGCAYASYRDDSSGRRSRAFIMVPRPGQSLKSLWQGLAARWSAGPRPHLTVLARMAPHQGLVGAIRTEAGILGVADCKNKAEVLKNLKRLHDAMQPKG